MLRHWLSCFLRSFSSETNLCCPTLNWEGGGFYCLHAAAIWFCTIIFTRFTGNCKGSLFLAVKKLCSTHWNVSYCDTGFVIFQLKNCVLYIHICIIIQFFFWRRGGVVSQFLLLHFPLPLVQITFPFIYEPDYPGNPKTLNCLVCFYYCTHQ